MLDKEILENVEKIIFDEKKEFLKTGFSDLDYVIKGIDKPRLITIGARVGMGKSSFLITLLINLLKQKKKCLFFTLDLSASHLILRMVSQISEIYLDYLPNNKMREYINSEKIHQAITAISEFNLDIVDECCNFNLIEEKIKEIKPEFIFIDYIQLVEMKSKKTRCEELSEVVRKLKQIAHDNDSTIFITSQLSRKNEDRYCKTPLLSDLKDCGDIENVSDVVLLLYRDEYYDNENPMLKGKADLIIAKNKFGPCGTINILFDKAMASFRERTKIEKM